MASFTLAVSAPSDAAAGGNDVTFLMNLPTAIEPDMIRKGTQLGAPTSMLSSAACLAACNGANGCQSWNFAKGTSLCTLQSDAPDVFYSLGNDCGLRSVWSYDAPSQCLTLSRAGANGSSNGDMSLCASASSSDGTSTVSFGTYNTGTGAFVDLAKSLNKATTGAHGAVAVTAHVAAGERGLYKGRTRSCSPCQICMLMV
jgi:hypothetical protein